MNPIASIVLAAGKSKRMKSQTPKVLHKLMGKTIMEYVLETCKEAGVSKIIPVIGHKKEMIMEYLGDDYSYAFQEEQLGTGHAVMQALPLLQDFEGEIMILCADMPLLSSDTLKSFIMMHKGCRAKISLLTAVMEDAGSLGRIVRDSLGHVQSIVEAADASPYQLAIKEVNTGTYLFSSSYLKEILPQLGRPNAQQEIYLTDSVIISAEKGIEVYAMSCPDPSESMGINSRCDLAEAAEVIRKRINSQLMTNGVTLYDPNNTYIEPSVVIEPDTEILPGCIIQGNTRIASRCVIGPNSHISDSIVEEDSIVMHSVILNSHIGQKNTIGPYAHVRPETETKENVKIGNFVETKKSQIGSGSKISHLSYVGDALLGENVNIGAGTITCNYDGKNKNATIIKNNAFIGSNSNLIAPVTIGEGSRTGAGSVVRKDVPDWTLAVGLPARNIKKLK